MRTIKFRGLRTNGKGWVYGLPIYGNLESTIVEIQSVKDRDLYDIMPESVGQFTGLKDKNGKECFEGDVLDNLEVVIFTQGAFMTSIGALAVSIEHREIIGNIHESPEQ